jgi:hypothetical protein
MATDDNSPGGAGGKDDVADIHAEIASVSALLESLSVGLEMLGRKAEARVIGPELFILRQLVDQVRDLFETLSQLWLHRLGDKSGA